MIIELKLTRGYSTKILEKDIDLVNGWSWYASGHDKIYGARKDYLTQRIVYIHQQILGVMPWELKGLEVDHIDGDTLNNCRDNLRLVTHSVNLMNTDRHKNRKGYSLNIRTGKWNCYIDEPNKPRKYLGHASTKEEAIEKVRLARHTNAN